MNSQAQLKEQIRHIGHEIRNSLSICDIYSEILKKHLAKENIKNESVDNAVNCIQNAVKLIGNNLLDLKSMGEIVVHTCDSDKLLKACVEMASAYDKEKNIVFVTEFVSNEKVLVDENKFQACIINIIKNAIEAIKNAGRIKITSKAEGEYLSVIISNNGTSIPQEIQKKVFTDGFTTKSSGSGIGLYLCKKNIEEMGGTLQLISSDETSTKFEIKVKLA